MKKQKLRSVLFIFSHNIKHSRINRINKIGKLYNLCIWYRLYSIYVTYIVYAILGKMNIFCSYLKNNSKSFSSSSCSYLVLLGF